VSYSDPEHDRVFDVSRQQVRSYYSEMREEEWRRLARDPYHRLEFDTTMHFFKEYSPRKGLVLDAGGGPGRYTLELAKLGYEVVLLDLTPELLGIAINRIKKAKVAEKVKQVLQGSIDDLSMFDENTFDAVICLGALSHVVDKEDRERAIDELVRVAKKDAPIFVSVIGRLAILVCGLVHWPEDMEIDGLYQKLDETGDYRGGPGVHARGRSFAPCHLYLSEELEGSFKKRGVKVLEMVGLQGLATRHQKETNRLFKKYPKGWKNWQELHLRTCTHRSMVDLSQHFMIICRK
jgi:2-polyprenyl-3-methyl-5-hydroxy-6-metoxy-1,4-benzoquinol methylase